MTNAVTKDAEVVAKALMEIERLISQYEALGPRDPHRTINEIGLILDKHKPISAAIRIEAGYGLRVVK